MKKQVQLTGERKWFGSDWLTIQNEIYKVIEGLFGQYNQACIISGCIVSGTTGAYDISAGIVLIKDETGAYQFAEFAGTTGVDLPGYLVLTKATTNFLYEDGNNKAKLVTYTADYTTDAPDSGVDYVGMDVSGNLTWEQVTGIAMVVKIGTLSTGHTVKFDREYSELFSSVSAGAIQVAFDFTNARAGMVTRMRFAFSSGNSLTIASPPEANILKDEGDLSMAPSNTNILYFIYCGLNEDGKHEISYVLKQV